MDYLSPSLACSRNCTHICHDGQRNILSQFGIIHIQERCKGQGKYSESCGDGADLGAELVALGLRIKEITGDGKSFQVRNVWLLFHRIM